VIRQLEDRTKAWLRMAGLPVPDGESVDTAIGAAAAAARMGGDVILKALVPAGRRGKGGGVIRAATPDEAGAVAEGLLGRVLGSYQVNRVYVERAVKIRTELYLAFLFDHNGAKVIVSRNGGVDIEAIAAADEQSLVTHSIDPIKGLPSWQALDLWRRTGIRGLLLRDLGALTSELYSRFTDRDAELLEINPLAVDGNGHLVLVGTMLALDANAKGRHPEWAADYAETAISASQNPRESKVAAIDASIPGGECRYVELDGDIGLLVGGGGAGLYQHDRLLAAGGRPANHSVTPPVGADNRKLKSVIEAIFDNPRTKALLVGFNFAQMARADIRVRTLLEVIDEMGIDTSKFPIVIRLFGAGEDEARASVAGRAGIHYLPRVASLDDAIRLVVALVAGQMSTTG